MRTGSRAAGRLFTGAVVVAVALTGMAGASAAAPGRGGARAAVAPGIRLWAQRYNGTADSGDTATAITVSPDGSTVFVTGRSEGRADGKVSYDYLTIAYRAATGRRLWISRYNGPANGDDIARAIAVTPDGRAVLVTGESEGKRSGWDWATVAYAAATGRQLWMRRYNGAGDSTDVAHAVTVSPDGRTVFVTGKAGTATLSEQYVTIAYRMATGTPLWVSAYGGDVASAVAVSPGGGTVFVTGLAFHPSTTDAVTVAYSASTGAQLWVSSYGPVDPALGLWPGLVVSPDGTAVYATATGEAGGTGGADEYATVAYSAATGAQLWAGTYAGPGIGSNLIGAPVVTPDGQMVVVAGDSASGGDRGTEEATVAYSAATGAQLWASRYPVADNSVAPAAAGISPDGKQVYVMGTGQPAHGKVNYAIVAYSASTGARLWASRYNGPANRADWAGAMAVDPGSGNVFVTGASAGHRTSDDYATVAFRG